VRHCVAKTHRERTCLLRTRTNVGGTVWNNFVKGIISYFNNNADALLEIQPIGLDKLSIQAAKSYTNYCSRDGDIAINALRLPVAHNTCSRGEWRSGDIDLDAFCIQFLQL